MSTIARIDRLLATSTGQTVGWILILGLELGFFTRTASNVTLVATVLGLGASWMLGASYGRHQTAQRAEQERETESKVE